MNAPASHPPAFQGGGGRLGLALGTPALGSWRLLSTFAYRDQRQRSPVRGCRGDELIDAMREVALEVGHDRQRAALHVPRSVFELRLHEIPHAADARRIVERERARVGE